MSWKLVAVHRIAHIIPSLAAGTGSTDFPVYNASTLDPSVVGSFAHGSSSYFELRWDRGAAGNFNAINCAIIVNHNLGSRDMTWTLYGDSSAGGTAHTLGATSPTTNADIFKALSESSTYRYHTLRVANDEGNAVSGVRVGVFSAGFYYDLGGANLRAGSDGVQSMGSGSLVSGEGTQHFLNYSEGARTISRTFRKVLHTDAQAIMKLLSRKYDPTTGDQTIDGVGGGGGSNPLALVDDDGNVYYGFVTGTASQVGPLYDEMTLSVTTIPHMGID